MRFDAIRCDAKFLHRIEAHRRFDVTRCASNRIASHRIASIASNFFTKLSRFTTNKNCSYYINETGYFHIESNRIASSCIDFRCKSMRIESSCIEHRCKFSMRIENFRCDVKSASQVLNFILSCVSTFDVFQWKHSFSMKYCVQEFNYLSEKNKIPVEKSCYSAKIG